MSKLYTERDIIEQGDYYSRHTSAMTGEGLDRKSDIAAELAHRDIQIDQLQARVAELEGEQLEVWLGSGDKLVADIYADDGGWAGVGIFNPPNEKTQGIGEKDDQIDGMSLDKNKAIILIKSTRPESLQVVVEELQEAMAKMGYTHPASAATLQFGNGNLVVVDGSFDDMPAVFISPAIDLGNAPGTALSGKDAERRTDMLYGDETVLLFKTAEHASVVAGALIRGNYASNYRPSPGYRKAAQIGQTIGVLAKNKEGRVCAVTDLGRCTWLSEDVTGAGDGDE